MHLGHRVHPCQRDGARRDQGRAGGAQNGAAENGAKDSRNEAEASARRTPTCSLSATVAGRPGRTPPSPHCTANAGCSCSTNYERIATATPLDDLFPPLMRPVSIPIPCNMPLRYTYRRVRAIIRTNETSDCMSLVSFRNYAHHHQRPCPG